MLKLMKVVKNASSFKFNSPKKHLSSIYPLYSSAHNLFSTTNSRANSTKRPYSTANNQSTDDISRRTWNTKDNREELYKFAQALGVIFGVLIYYFNHSDDIKKQKAQLGREITKELEEIKTKLRILINEWDAMNDSDKKKIDIGKINEYESTFEYSLRIVNRYDTGLVPEKMKIEADYQLERLRQTMKVFLKDKSAENTDKLRRCFFDTYNVINIITLATSMNTIEPNKMTDEQKVLLKKLNEGLSIDKIRHEVHAHRIKVFEKLKQEKIDDGTEKNTVYDANYVSTLVFGK